MNCAALISRLEANISQALVGKPQVVRLVVIGLLARGHLLIEDVPGVGKTTLAQALARSLGCSFQRIQFTSDLLPSDILGVSVYNPKTGEFVFKPGPIFAHIVLADEINRTTPKTQSGLLEAMNEFQVSLDHHTYPLSQPFMVLATQNPMEYQGTHPLPESQLDRFLLRVRIGYPERDDEKAILRGQGLAAIEAVRPVLSPDEVTLLQASCQRVCLDESVLDYVMALVDATRRTPLLALGASPRGAQGLVRAAQAQALADGRDYVIPDDIKALAVQVLAHRVLVRSRLESAGGQAVEGETVIRSLLQEIPVPR